MKLRRARATNDMTFRALERAVAGRNAAEQRATDMEKALNVIEAVAYEGTAGVISKTEALRAIQADCSAALSTDAAYEDRGPRGISDPVHKRGAFPEGNDGDTRAAKRFPPAREEARVTDCAHKDAVLQRDPSGSMNWRCRRCGLWARWDGNTRSFTAREEAL